MFKHFLVYAGILLVPGCSIQAQALDKNAFTEIAVKASIGSGEGQIGYKEFSPDFWVEPAAIAIDSKGNIYVADTLNKCIQKFSKEGKYLFKIDITTPLKRTNEYANDMTIDNADNLFVFIQNARIIYKFSANGTLIQTITYDVLLDAEKIMIDSEGQIYLYSNIVNALHKLGKEGAIVNNWLNVTSFFLDPDGNLFISENKVEWEKYDKNGKLIGLTVCSKEDVRVYFPASEGNGCHFPPQFIDKNGNRYFIIRNEELLKKTTSSLVFDRNGKFIKKINMPFSADIYPLSNMVKFSNDGNFYAEYGHIQEGFQIMRVKLLQN